MKYIIIGLGYFGSHLATNLVSAGHEVIGIDKNSTHIDELKDKITQVMIMDSTNANAMDSLPLSDVDAVIVAIGEEAGASILTLALLRKYPIKRLIGRAISPIHQSILSELGIEEIVHPEQDMARLVANILQVESAVNIHPIDEDYVIAEILVPEKYVGHTLESVNMGKRFDLKLVGIKTAAKEKKEKGLFRKDYKVDLSDNQIKILHDNEILIIAGRIDNIKKFTA